MRTIKTGLISILAIGLLAGSAIGVAAQEETPAADPTTTPATEPLTPAKVSGSLREEGALVQEPTEEMVAGVMEIRGVAWDGDLVEMDDPRLTGSSSIVSNENQFMTIEQDNIALQTHEFRIENEAGSWSGQGTTVLHESPDMPRNQATNLDTFVLTGDGAYEGLTAYLLVDWTKDPIAVEGVIVEGEMPPFPEALPAE